MDSPVILCRTIISAYPTISSELPGMESQRNEATENIDPPPLASVNEKISSDVIHSTSVETTENQEFSDAISSGSSFEILSMKEGAGEAQENRSDSISSSLENCGIAYDAKRYINNVCCCGYDFIYTKYLNHILFCLDAIYKCQLFIFG